MGIPSGGPPGYPSSQGQSSSGQYPVPPPPFSTPRPISTGHVRIDSQILKSSRPFAFNVTPARNNSTGNLEHNNNGHIDGNRTSFDNEESNNSNSFPLKSILPLQPNPTRKFLPFTTPSRALSPPPRSSRSTSPPPSASPQRTRSKSSRAHSPSGVKVTVTRSTADESSYGSIPSQADNAASPVDATPGNFARPMTAPNRRAAPSGVIVVTAPPRPRTMSTDMQRPVDPVDVLDIRRSSTVGRHPYAHT
jgi:hypothetical protein